MTHAASEDPAGAELSLVGTRDEAPLVPGARRRLYAFAFAAVLLLAFAVRLWVALANPEVSPDGAYYYLPLAEAIAEGRPLPARHVEVPPLYFVLAGDLARVLRDVELSARLVSVAGGMLACIFVFLLARFLMGPYVAVVAMSLLAFHPYQVTHSAETGVDALGVAWFCATAYALTRYAVRPRGVTALAIGCCAALLALTRVEGAFFLPLLLGIMLYLPRGGPVSWRRRAMHGALMLLLFFLAVWPRLQQVHAATGWWVIDTRQVTQPLRLLRKYLAPQETSTSDFPRPVRVAVAGSVTAAADAQESVGAKVQPPHRSDALLRILPRWKRRARAFLSSLGPATFFLGIYALVRRGRRAMREEWASGLMALASFAAMSLGMVVSRRYSLSIGAVWQMWGAAGLLFLLRWLFAAPLKRVWPRALDLGTSPLIVTLAVALPLLQILAVPGRLDHPQHEGYRAMGAWIMENLGEGQRIAASRRFLAWYARAEHVELPGARACQQWRPGDFWRYARAQRAQFILVDPDAARWGPRLHEALASGGLAGGRVVHEVNTQAGKFFLIAVPAGEISASGGTPP